MLINLPIANRCARLLPLCLVALMCCCGQACLPSLRGEGGDAGAILADSQHREIVIDGDTAEWPSQVAAYSDEHFLYVRFTISQEQITLQAAPQTVALFIDADASKATGRVFADPALAPLGVDLLLRFSPPGKNGKPTVGCDLAALDASGNRTPLSTTDYDIVFAPTYASSWYELRICRTPTNKANLPLTGLLGEGRVAGVAGVLGAGETLDMAAEPFSVTTDVVCPGGRRLASLALPAKPAGAVRVVSWNIEVTKPAANPAPFARVLNALSPDVILFQEWDKGDAAEVTKWLTTNFSAKGSWNVVKAPGTMANGGAVLIATIFPLTRADNDRLTCTYVDDRGANETKPIRFVAATAQSPLGPMLLASMHLKARGSKNSIEDRRRMAEAISINNYISSGSFPAIRVLAGDLNLVASRPPLELLRAGIDSDGSDLAVAQPRVLGDAAFYSWSSAENAFTPGRLDWLIYSDATARAENAFIFDSARLDPQSLTAIGVQSGDTAQSDHLPLVVDLVRP